MNRKLKTVLMFLLCVVAAGPLRAQEPDAAGKGITQIIVQRTECYGPCPIDSLSLSADGKAAYSGHGGRTPRVGHYTGSVSPYGFARLAAWIEQQGFYEMRSEVTSDGEAYMTTDTPDLIIAVVRDKKPRVVAFRGGASTPRAWQMEMVIRGAASDVSWSKDEAASASGIQGVAERPLTERERTLFANRPEIKTMRLPFALVSVAKEGDSTNPSWCVSDRAGKFQLALPPGRYFLTASIAQPADAHRIQEPLYWFAEAQTLAVEAGKVAAATIVFGDYADKRPEPRPR